MKSEIAEVTASGQLRPTFHAGQRRAWRSKRRFVFIIAGHQSGKTTFGPWWLLREIQRCGAGDYLAVTSTYDLFKLKMLPEMRRYFEIIQGWTFHGGDRVLTNPAGDTRIILRAASSDGGLESATAKAAWLDECGQDKFRLSSWEAIQRRLSLFQGRVLGTTTPYNLGWLKTQIFDRWRAGDPDYQVVQFKSTMNPAFPQAEYDRARQIMPRWKFEMFYNGNFSKPAGLIYDNFDSERQVITPFEIPNGWTRYGGIDFGGVNTAAVCYAKHPETGVLYLTNEYLAGGKTSADHASDLKHWNAAAWVGGSWSEDQWRLEMRKGGLPVQRPPIKEVEVGIDRVYGYHAKQAIYVFDTCQRYLDEKGSYSRELDANGQPTTRIKDKNTYHLLDAERYIISWLRGDGNWLVSGMESDNE